MVKKAAETSFESTVESNDLQPVSSKASVADIEDLSLSTQVDADKLTKKDKIRGFMKLRRKADEYRNASKRIEDFEEVNYRLSKKELKVQAARCMDCVSNCIILGKYLFYIRVCHFVNQILGVQLV